MFKFMIKKQSVSFIDRNYSYYQNKLMDLPDNVKNFVGQIVMLYMLTIFYIYDIITYENRV